MLFACVVIIPFLCAALVPAADLLGEKFRNNFAVFSGFLIAALTLALIPFIRQGSGISFNWIPGIAPVGINLDALSVNIAVIAGVIGSLIVLYSTKYMAHEEGGMRYYALTLLFIGAMIGLVLSDNFLTLYIFWEIVGVCSYALIGFFYKDPKAVRAGIKAFITTRIGDVGLLIGILILFLNTSTFNINEIVTKLPTIPAPVLAAAGFCFMLGAIGKSAQFPLHVWLPDAMEAPTTTSALIHAATMVNAGVYLMARTYPIFSGVPGWAATLAWVGVITAFIAASMALVEKDLKRTLAYSTVSQLGFMMLAIGTGALFASQLHLMSHAVFKALLFLSAGAVIHEVGTRNMYEMGGLFKQMTITGTCFCVGVLALIGIPFFNGFFSKDLILSKLLSAHYMPLFLLAALTTLFTISYSLKMFYLVFMGNGRHVKAKDAPWQMTAPLVLLAVGSVTSWLLVSRFSKGLSASGINVEPLGIIAMLKEMFLSRLILVSLGVIILGFFIYYYRAFVRKYFNFLIEPFFAVARAGFWFDTFYYWIIGLFTRAAEIVLNVFDEGLNRANYAIGDMSCSFSAVFRKTHTGELNFNVIGIALGLGLVIVMVFWK